jgi:hypothetical protein
VSENGMVERVARALWEADGLGVNGNAWRWETIDAATKEPSLRRARAAIAAMREPTLEMANAPYRPDACIPQTDPPCYPIAYQRMIDAALKD